MHDALTVPALPRAARPAARLLIAALAAALVLAPVAGCSGGGASRPSASASAATSPSTDAATAALLDAARRRLDAARTVRFALSSSNVPGGGTRLIGGSGSMTRPTPSSGAFRGAVSVLLNGSKVTVSMVSLGGKVYIKLPFSQNYQVADPAGFGLSDPAQLISAKDGISRLFFRLQDARSLGRRRVGGDVVQQVEGTVPGVLVADLLTSAEPMKPVKVVLSIVPGSGELRQAVLTGPFFVKGTDSTYVLTLDRYDEKVTITAPAVT